MSIPQRVTINVLGVHVDTVSLTDLVKRAEAFVSLVASA
jgi:hypothetical protein